MITCPNCGQKNSNYASICNTCGTELKEVQTEQGEKQTSSAALPINQAHHPNQSNGGTLHQPVNMQKWEYLKVEQSRGFSAPITGGKPTEWYPKVELEKLGREGWELVSVWAESTHHGNEWAGVTSDVIWVFKRPIP